MEQNEWDSYVQKISTCPYPILPDFIKNQEDWHCRSVVGRMLFLLKDVEGAMRVLSTVRDIEIDMDQYPEVGMSDAEHKCLCLRDLGEIVWVLTQKVDVALYYFDKAYELCQNYKHPFHAAKRGAIWARRLEIKRESGSLKDALTECLTKMEEQNPEDKINQILFYGNKFLAECFAEKGDYDKAVDHMAEAYKYFPLSIAGKRDVAEAAAESDRLESYKKYMHCTTLQYMPWESFNVPTLEEVRKKQYENYLKRQAKQAVDDRIIKAENYVNPEEIN